MKIYVWTPSSGESRFKRSGLVWGCPVPLKQYGAVVWELEVVFVGAYQRVMPQKPSQSTRFNRGEWYKQLHHSGHPEYAFDTSCIRSIKKV